MEATGSWPWSWSYRNKTGGSSSTTISIGSSSAGTISTGYRSTRSNLYLISMEAAMAMQLEDGEEEETASEKKMDIKSLPKEFLGSSIEEGSGDMSVLERWLTELGVRWVLLVADAGDLRHHHTSSLDAHSWTRALSEITGTVREFNWSAWRLPGRGLTSIIYEQENQEVQAAREQLQIDSVEQEDMTEQIQVAIFFQQAMLKMLAFVDVIVAPNLTCQAFIDNNPVPVPDSYQKLHTLLRVRDALSNAIYGVDESLCYLRPPAQVETIMGEIVSLLSAKKSKAGEAIWSAMEEIRTRILEPESMEEDQNPQAGSSGIHKVTLSLLSYINFLGAYSSSVEQILSEAASLGEYTPQIDEATPLNSLMEEMVSCLYEKLATKSEELPDQSLKFLFLLNNSFFIRDRLHNTDYFRGSYKTALFDKVRGYMDSYLQVSWAPVLACLFTPAPGCIGKKYSPLPKFESEFQKTYTTQKLWKVPDPGLRKTLREAITEQIIPDYTKYIKHNDVTAPKLTPLYLKEMLEELFEG